MITVFHAIQSLVPGAEVSVGLYDQKIEWHKPETAPVTLEQIQAEQQRLQQAYDWNEYQRNRAREYPSIQEQLDALYHAGVFPSVMADRIRAVKEKYPRYSPDHVQTSEQTAPTMSVDEWLAQETKVPAEQWLAQQQSTTHMTREEWLASQSEVKTVNDSTLINTVTVARTMTSEEWLREQASLESVQKMTREQWLEQQKTIVQPSQMTREQWLAEQAKIK
jgi:GTPase SAR1 family protein